MEDNCSICLGEITKSFFVTSCGHMFHIKCISTWLKRSGKCPLCRNIVIPTMENIYPIPEDEVQEYLFEYNISISSTTSRVRISGGSVSQQEVLHPYSYNMELSGNELASIIGDIKNNIGSVDMDKLLMWLTRREIMRR